jgi:hypothetical protein
VGRLVGMDRLRHVQGWLSRIPLVHRLAEDQIYVLAPA